jgi:hypothetical protein
MDTSLTLQAATAATFDTGWRQAPGNAWTDSSLVLTLTGAGAVLLTLQSRDDDSTNTVYRQEVSWAASGSQTITMPTPFFGQLRLTGEVKAAGGTIAVAISGSFGPSPVTGPNGESVFSGPVVAPQASGINAPLLLGEPPSAGVMSINGSSTTARSAYEGGNGGDTSTPLSPFSVYNELVGSPYTLRYHGYAGQTSATIDPATPINAAADGAVITVMQFAANDLDQTEAKADAAFEITKNRALSELIAGRYPLIHVPHIKQGAQDNHRGVARYAILCEEWARRMGLRIVRADYALCAHTDLVGTAKANVMASGDTQHISSYGANVIGAEYFESLRNRVAWRIGSVGYNAAGYFTELLSNPRMTGTSGTNGTGSSGTVAANCTSVRGSGAATCVASKGTDSEGSYQDLTITFSAANERWDFLAIDTSPAINARVRAGKSYVGLADVEVISGPVKRRSLIISTTNRYFGTPFELASSAWVDQAMPVGRAVLRTLPFVPGDNGNFNNAPQLYISSSAAGTAVVRIRGISVRETI